MRIAFSTIQGGDFKEAGTATTTLKKLLKKINIDATDMRRVVIAAFEAEMNVVIHAHHGNMRAIINSEEIEVEVRDEGPGIPDIELAMKEGYSTAPPAARQLGYGAGMGLPNMKKNSDIFQITSTVGVGTTVVYSVFFKTQESPAVGRNSIRITGSKCNRCLFCVRACPTKAIRVYGGFPQIMNELCIDCTACIDACKTGALTVADATTEAKSSKYKLLFVPPHFLAQFSASITPQRVLASLDMLGYQEVYVTELWETALRNALIEYSSKKACQLPLISSACPVVANLITLRFQALIKNLAPFLSPLEAARKQFNGESAAFVVCCPCQMTALSSKLLSRNTEIITPSVFRQVVQPLVMEESNIPQLSQRSTEAPTMIYENADILQVSGIKHVINALERIENGRLRDVRILEPYACECGCYGSPLLTEQPFVAKHRWTRTRIDQACPADAVRREAPYIPRSGMKLSSDISNAIAKLSEMEELAKSLPHKDCGLCGAPTCDDLAEDVVMGRINKTVCPYVVDNSGEGLWTFEKSPDN